MESNEKKQERLSWCRFTPAIPRLVLLDVFQEGTRRIQLHQIVCDTGRSVPYLVHCAAVWITMTQ